jgi:glycosyltransferase involved in cell wall biosynthesis
MPLRIGFNAYLLNAPAVRGWNRYTINLLEELGRLDLKLVLYARQPIHPDYLDRLPAGSFEVITAPASGYLAWQERWLPERCRLDRIDVFHCPMNYGLPWSTPCPRVLTLHDAIDFIYYGRRRSLRDRLRPAAIKTDLLHLTARTRADRIITVSQHACDDIVNYLRVPRSKVTVIYEAADPLFARPVTDELRQHVRSKFQLPDRYLFYVGGWEGRKNVPFLLKALASANAPGVCLVLAGGSPEARAHLSLQAVELGVADRTHFLPWIEEAELPALYAEALAFVYPSEYEGFGLQLCEAMSVGCPTLAARATSLVEILGEGGASFRLDSTDELAALITRVAADPSFRDDLVARARRRIRDFSWAQAAQQTAAVYEAAVRDCRSE